MITTIELCSVCGRPPGNRIVYRNGLFLCCSRFCAKDSIGLNVWNEWFDQECRHRLQRQSRAAKKVVDFPKR